MSSLYIYKSRTCPSVFISGTAACFDMRKDTSVPWGKCHLGSDIFWVL